MQIDFEFSGETTDGCSALQERKRALAEAVITQDDSVMRRLTVDDLELLLG